MKKLIALTESWGEAVTFFHKMIALHDSTIEAIEFVQDKARCTILINEVYGRSGEHCLSLAYKFLYVKLTGARIDKPNMVANVLGQDIVLAELRPGSLWISTIAGSLTFQFDTISFGVPEEEFGADAK